MIIKQEEIADCGVCSLLSIIRYYGGDISLEQLRINSNTTKDGVNAYNLIECAKTYGLNAKCIKQDTLSNKNFPYIAHIKINKSLSHFIVIYKIDKNKVTVMDPAYGKKIMDIDELQKSFSGYIIFFTPNSNLVKYKNTNIVNKNIILNLKNNKMYFFKIISINMIIILLSILESSYISIISNNPTKKVIIACITLVILNCYLFYISNIKVNKLTNKITYNLELNFFNHVFKLPLKYIHIKDREEILKRFIDIEEIISITLNIILKSSMSLIIISIILIIIFLINIKIFFITLLFIFTKIFISYFYSKKLIKNINEAILSENEYKSKLTNYNLSIISILHNKKEIYYINKLKILFNNYLNDNFKYNKSLSKIISLNESFVSILNIVVISFYLLYIQNYQMLFIVYFLINMLNSSLNDITNQFPNIIYRNKIIYKINDFYNLEIEKDNLKQKFINGDIEIKNLYFKYQDKIVIKNMNLLIKKGEKIIIKGESGCGKSTLCKLLFKYYDNYKGLIKINNKEIRKISTSSIRSNITYSSQNESIIQGTIRENILMGNHISDTKLNNIINISKLDNLLNKKIFGLDTYLFGGGNEVSGGEKQLIILARALVRNPKILILDESLSMVDEHLEKTIISNIFNEYKNATIIYITHKNIDISNSRTIYV